MTPIIMCVLLLINLEASLVCENNSYYVTMMSLGSVISPKLSLD